MYYSKTQQPFAFLYFAALSGALDDYHDFWKFWLSFPIAPVREQARLYQESLSVTAIDLLDLRDGSGTDSWFHFMEDGMATFANVFLATVGFLRNPPRTFEMLEKNRFEFENHQYLREGLAMYKDPEMPPRPFRMDAPTSPNRRSTRHQSATSRAD
jgi:hypothetical protein